MAPNCSSIDTNPLENTMRKTHLQDTKRYGPTCQSGRAGGALRGEHITVKFDEFKVSPGPCARCASSKLFAFLQRKAA